MSELTQSKAWKDLEAHQREVVTLHMRDLFTQDARRFDKFSLRFKDILLDFSKNRITDETLHLLVQLAEESGLRARIDAMFQGEKINITEDRAVLHVALRAPRRTSIVVDGTGGSVGPRPHIPRRYLQPGRATPAPAEQDGVPGRRDR